MSSFVESVSYARINKNIMIVWVSLSHTDFDFQMSDDPPLTFLYMLHSLLYYVHQRNFMCDDHQLPSTYLIVVSTP